MIKTNEYNQIHKKDTVSCDLTAVTLLGTALSKQYFIKYGDKCKTQDYYDFVKEFEEANPHIALKSV